MATNMQTKTHNADAVERTYPGEVFSPRVDILESADGLTLYADLPGVTAENLELRFENGELAIHGHCSARHQGERFLTQEYGVGDFYRAFSISNTIDASRISAELRQGVLVVQLPKSEALKPKRIAVAGH